MKKFISALLALTLSLSSAAAVFAEPYGSERFSDIATGDYDWARDYINSMADKGLISGYEDGTFRPDNDVTHLEAISLFARAMGSNDDVNAPVLEIAHDRYDAILNNYSLTWGTDEIAYLMYKGVLKKTDLDTYLKDNEKNTPMKRYEAAIIITKAMGGENDALSQLGVVLDYNDAREVPSNAIQYVSYATEAGIMQGMGDGTFSPNTSVKRSQMAVMLSRTVDKTDYEFKNVKITALDTNTSTITAENSNGESIEYTYNENTEMRALGDDISPSSVPIGASAVLTLSLGNLICVEALSDQPDEVITGKYVSYASTSGKTTIRVIPSGETETKSYVCGSDLTVTYDGSPATVRSFSNGDVITLELTNGTIKKISGGAKTETINNATVENISIGREITMTISHAKDEYNGQTYTVDDDVLVKKNDAESSLDNVYNGDKVNLTLEYGVITRVAASSTRKVIEGTITALTISNQSEMSVKVNGTVSTYQIPRDVEILINGEEGSLYDFRVNDAVKLTLDSDAITKIVATSTQESSGSVTGVVTAVNKSYGVISVLPDGAEDAKQVYCKDDTTTFITADGKSKKMADIKTGQTVDVRGTVSSGVFIGKLVIIVSEE